MEQFRLFDMEETSSAWKMTIEQLSSLEREGLGFYKIEWKRSVCIVNVIDFT